MATDSPSRDDAPSVRRDIDAYPNDRRHNVVAMVLQLYGDHDPDGSKTLARYVIRAEDRSNQRNGYEGPPLDHEVTRALGALVRRGHNELTRDEIYAALFDAWTEGHS